MDTHVLPQIIFRISDFGETFVKSGETSISSMIMQRLLTSFTVLIY